MAGSKGTADVARYRTLGEGSPKQTIRFGTPASKEMPIDRPLVTESKWHYRPKGASSVAKFDAPDRSNQPTVACGDALASYYGIMLRPNWSVTV
jgi:hypothetical protein